LLGKMIEGIKAGLGWLADTVTQIGETISSGIQSIVAQAVDWGRNIVQGIIDGITGMLGSLAAKAGEIGTTISSAVTTGGAVAAFIPGGRPGDAGTEVVPAPAVVADTGGILPSGYAALNRSGRDEYVLPPGKAPITIQVGGIHITAGPGANGAQLAEEVARQLAPRLQAALANMT
jgi:hypothetical protein